jgi:hypothetical protein
MFIGLPLRKWSLDEFIRETTTFVEEAIVSIYKFDKGTQIYHRWERYRD